MNRPYLTDWELYIVLCEYQRLQRITFSKAVFDALLKAQQLDTILSLSFTHIKSVSSPTDIPANQIVELSFTQKQEFYHWLELYLKDYRNNSLKTKNQSFYPYASSMHYSLDILKHTESPRNSDEMQLSPLANRQDIIADIDITKIRFYEDILCLLQYEYITLSAIKLNQKEILTYKSCKKLPHPYFTLEIDTVPNKRFCDIEKKLLQPQITSNLTPFVTLTSSIVPSSETISSEVSTFSTSTKDLHKIDIEKDFLPYKDALVLLALYTKKDFLLFPKKAKEQLKAISQMKFIKIITGTAKHIKYTLKKSKNLSKRDNLNITDDTCCIMLSNRGRLNDFVNKYLDKYQHDNLNNHSQYCLYNKSWDATVRVLNSEKGEWNGNYVVKPEIIEKHKETLKGNITWIECLFLLVRTNLIQLTEAELEWGRTIAFSFGITQTDEIPLVENALCSYLDISITRQNEVKYRGYTIDFTPNSREFILLKFLLQNKGAKGRTSKIVADYFTKEFKKLGLSFNPGKKFENNLTGYKLEINNKFKAHANKKKFSIDFEITAGKTENRLVHLAEYNKKMSRKGKKKSPRKV